MTKMNGVYVWICCGLADNLVNGAGRPNNRRVASTLAGKVWLCPLHPMSPAMPPAPAVPRYTRHAPLCPLCPDS